MFSQHAACHHYGLCQVRLVDHIAYKRLAIACLLGKADGIAVMLCLHAQTGEQFSHGRIALEAVSEKARKHNLRLIVTGQRHHFIPI